MAKKKKKTAVKKKRKVAKKATKRGAKKKTVKRKVAKKATKKKGGKKKRKVNSAFMKKFTTSPQLKAIVGASKISRPHATKKVWEYIRKHKLQDKRNRRQINVGGTALGKLFSGKKSISMFEIAKGINKHISD